MTISHESELTEAERELIGSRADVLIPSAEGMPSASEAEVPTRWIDAALAARPDLVSVFREALAVGRDLSPEQAIEDLHQQNPELFDAFSVLSAGAYLMNPEVKRLIGYPGQEERPISGDDMPSYIDMLETVAMREDIHRPTITH